MNSVQQPGGGTVRVRALKGFFATVAGQYSEIHPASVVDVSRELAAMMISSRKAEQVETAVPLSRAAEPKRTVVVDPAIERLDRLQASVERLAEVVASLVTAQAAANKKEK